MKHASDNKSREKHFIEEIETIPQKRSNTKKIFIGILVAAIVASGVIVPVVVARQNKISENEKTVTPSEILYTDARIAEARSLTAAAKATRSMSENIKVPITAYSLKVDGRTIAVMTSDEEIRTVLSSIKKKAVKDFVDAKAQFVEKVEILEGMHMRSELTDKEGLQSILSEKSEITTTHTIKNKETRASIAKYYGISVDELEKQNPAIKESKIKTGDKLTIKYNKLPISIKFTVTETENRVEKFKKETVKDDKLSTSYKEVTTKGKDGEIKTTSQVTYIDGRAVSEKVLYKEVISEVVNEVTTIGTNDKVGASLGKFSWPLPNYDTITSGFGPRWGTNHNGLDISGSGVYGADILASDGGTVILAQEDNSGYGKYVIIDHENGYQTLYGHCSKLCVSAGDKVSAGQKIAEVGSTGYSTGPHLHFEIIDNGTKIDPYPFLFS